MSRTYEVGRLYLVPACSGAYVPESATLYEALRRYLKAAYHYEQKREPTFLPPFGKNSVPIIIMLPAQEGPSFSGASETR